MRASVIVKSKVIQDQKRAEWEATNNFLVIRIWATTNNPYSAVERR
jgi:hypothetical protein